MKRPDLTRLKALLGGRGIYAAAAAGIIAVGGVGAAAYNRAVKKINDGLGSTVPGITSSRSGEVYADEKKTDVPKQTDSSTASDSDADSRKDTESKASSSKGTDDSSTASPKPISQPNVKPVEGEVIVPYSFGELVKSKTLDVWRTHDGADIKADKGTPVKAMNHGEVSKIWEDALWGNCISIDHGSGIVSYYYNLSPSMTVEEGDEVDAGQVIGTVGDTAQVEAAEPSHLHFAVKRSGEWTDPISFIDPFSNK